MRLSHIFLLSTIAMSGSAIARDVNMMRFGAGEAALPTATPSGDDDIVLSRSAALGSNPFVEAGENPSSVTDVMRSAFDDVASKSVPSNPLDAIDLDNLPTKNVPLPSWMRSTDMAISALLSRFIAGSGCDGAVYKPAWWLSRAAEARRRYYFPAMASIACEVGVSTLMFDALITQESGYNPSAISSAGAMGMAQIIPDTARYLGLYSPFDPVANMRAGARYLKEQLDRFGGRSDLALAAYNAGPRRVERNWAVPRIRETINYVNVITLNWSRLAYLHDATSPSVDRGQLAAAVVDSFPYRRATFLNFTGP